MSNEPNTPAFDAESFSISHLTESPEGFRVATGQALGRTAALGHDVVLDPTEAERSIIAEGMRREMRFSGVDKLREARTAYWEAVSSDAPDAKAKKQVFLDARTAYQENGKKIGLRNITADGNNLNIDVQTVPFPMYSMLARPETSPGLLEMSRAAGVAMVVHTTDGRLVVQHRAIEKVKLHGPGKTRGNASYADIPGTSVAGMMDATLRNEDRAPGTPDAIDTDTVKGMILKEAGEELGLAPTDFEQIRIVGVAQDKIKPHDEILLVADAKMSATELKEVSRLSPRNKNLDDFDMEEKFFDIDASPTSIETLLCDVKCPLPPTHAASLVAAGYLLVLQEQGRDAAIVWRDSMQTRVSENYAQINTIVQDFYRNNPEAAEQVPERYWGKQVPRRNLEGYDPAYAPEEQGLPAFEDEMTRTGLMPETRRHVKTAYLFDVDGVVTNPQEKRITDERVLTEIAKRLEASEVVGFNTGRSTEWVIRNVINPLLTHLEDPSLLTNVIVIGEKGATWATFDETTGEPQYGQVDSVTIPIDLRVQLEELTQQYGDTMANLDPKHTMFSAEMLDGHNLTDFSKVQAEFTERVRQLLAETGADKNFAVDPTTIATDIENPHVGKALGADRFIDFLRLRNLKVAKFVTFGDSASDLDMTAELARRGQDATMVYVGDSAKLPARPKGYSIVTAPGFEKATATYLHQNG